MKILLDTHIWLWWVNQNSELSPEHIHLIENAEEIFISSISCWEVTQLSQRQRIILPQMASKWFQLALDETGISCIPISKQIAIRAGELPYHHRDPADRFIIATALEDNLYLMSFDQQFPTFQDIQPLLLSQKLIKPEP
jgi:PIN domain nuclease of toxin-antitoxin system